MQSFLKDIFTKWGLPDKMKFDNGRPFGDPTGQTIPLLALWLTALDIEVIWNDPGCPTQNANVERMQEVSQRWSIPKNFTSIKQLQKALNKSCYRHVHQLKCRRLNNKTRIEYYPDLNFSGKTFDPNYFHWNRVKQFISQGVWERLVSSSGYISFYHQQWYIGKKLSGKKVEVRLCPCTNNWLVTNDAGVIVKKRYNELLNEQNIKELKLKRKNTHRKNE